MTELPKCEEGYRWLMEGERISRAAGDEWPWGDQWLLTTDYDGKLATEDRLYRRPVKQEQEKPMRTAEQAYDEAEKSGVVKAYYTNSRIIQVRSRFMDWEDYTNDSPNFTNPCWEWRIQPAEITPTVAKWHKIERDPVKARQMEQPTNSVLLWSSGNNPWSGLIFAFPSATHWAPLPAGPKDGE